MSRTDHSAKMDTGWLGALLITGVVRPNVVLRVEGDVGADATTSADFRSVTLSFSTAF